jgi:hypothetical protein
VSLVAADGDAPLTTCSRRSDRRPPRLRQLRMSLFHSTALQLPGARWSVLNTSLNASVSGTGGAGACYGSAAEPLNESDRASSMAGRRRRPGVRESGEHMPWWDVVKAEQGEMALRVSQHELLPLSGGHCLVIVAPAVYAPEFNTSTRRLGVSKKVFRARRHGAMGSSIRVENLVHWKALE